MAGAGQELHVLRVFCDRADEYGNPLGVFLDGASVPEVERQGIAADLGYSETVFVDDRRRGAIRIFTPELELPLAGHPLVGTAWLLAREGDAVEMLRPPAGEVAVRYEDGLTWVTARPEWAPHFDFVELAAPDDVDALDGPPPDMGWVGMWAWLDREAGIVRERVFVPEAGIAEDEATGAAAMLLVSQLDRPIEIQQGRGSLIHARPLDDGRVEIGGRVVLDEVRNH